MRVAGPGAELLYPTQLVGDRDWSLPSNHIGDRLARDVLHDDVGLRVDLAEVMDSDDVRMIQDGSRPGLARKPLAGIGDIHVSREDLDCDHPSEHRVVCDVDASHAAAAKPPLNLI